MRLQGALGVILAGGQSQRIGVPDKCLVEINARTMLDRIIERLALQVPQIIISANGDPARFTGYPCTVIADPADISPHAGPAAGLLAALAHAEEHQFTRVLTIPGDAPLFPHSLAAKLDAAMARGDSASAVAVSGGQRHPVFALWRTALAPRLREAVRGGERGLWKLQDRFGTTKVAFPMADHDPFSGVNTPADLAAMRALVCRIEQR